jgi:hypothetical protein
MVRDTIYTEVHFFTSGMLSEDGMEYMKAPVRNVWLKTWKLKESVKWSPSQLM